MFTFEITACWSSSAAGSKACGRCGGALHFEVIAYLRLPRELRAGEHVQAFWLGEELDPKALRELRERRKANLALDTEGRLVYLAESPWVLKMAQEQHAGVVWRDTSE